MLSRPSTAYPQPEHYCDSRCDVRCSHAVNLLCRPISFCEIRFIGSERSRQSELQPAPLKLVQRNGAALASERTRNSRRESRHGALKEALDQR